MVFKRDIVARPFCCGPFNFCLIVNQAVLTVVKFQATLWPALLRLMPTGTPISWRERVRICVGAMLGIAISATLTAKWSMAIGSASPWLIAPLGASAVLLFGVPSSPLAQPWSLLGGNMISAVIGVACARWIGESMIAATLAVTLAIAAMLLLRCMHPPSGAVALTAVLGGPAVHAVGFNFIWMPVAINSLLLLLVALGYHALTRHRYPHLASHASDNVDTASRPQLGFTAADLNAVLKEQNELFDIDPGDLAALLRQAELKAYRRRFEEITCADIMSPDPVTVEFGASLEEAWTQLQRYRIKALPVIDRSRRVIGIITLADFMKHAQLHTHAKLAEKLQRFVARITTLHADKPDVVGQIMTTAVCTARADQSIVELVPSFADSGHHHIPIVDHERRLVGILTQSDLMAALYKQRLRESWQA